MKRILIFLIALTLSEILIGQSPNGQGLITGTSDFVALDNWQVNPLLVEAGPNSFYWISGCYNANAFHQSQFSLSSNYQNIFFIKYNEEGNSLGSNYIRGVYSTTGAFSFDGGLTVMANAGNDIDAGEMYLPINDASNLEFLAKYDQTCKLVDIVSIWNLAPLQYVYSYVEMDQQNGAFYIFGTHSEILEIKDQGTIGKDWPGQYMYVLKYSRDLQFEWAYTAGFEADLGFPNFNMLKAIPDAQGNVLITGNLKGDSRAVFGEDILKLYQEERGLFAVKLDRNGNQVWIQEGSMNGDSYETHIHKGMAMKNGDLVLAGITTTGYFQLGDVKINFENGSGFANQFVYRIGPNGATLWDVTFQCMGKSQGQDKKGTEEHGGKKGVESEEFVSDFYYDALQWNNDVLYLTGTFLSDSFEVADRILEKKFTEGAFIATVDLHTGDPVWGYGLSTDWINLHGFDVDGSGYVSLMGRTTELQSFQDLKENVSPSPKTVFHLGLDFNGNPIWLNNAHLQGLGFGISGADLEVLRNGEVFSSIYLSDTDYLVVGGSQLIVDFPYSNWLIALNATSELGGEVSDKSGNPVYPGYIRAYKSASSGAYPMVESAMLDETGRYLFEGLYPGNYTLQVVPDPEAFPEAIPTYLGDIVDWNGAQFNDFSVDDRASFLDIQITDVPKLTSEDGGGSLSGNLSYEEEGVLKGTMARPVKKGSVILTKRVKKSTHSGEVVAYIETDEFGNYIFDYVPNGQYLLLVDIPGLAMTEVHEVTIQGDQVKYGLDYTVGYNEIYTYTGVGIQPEETTDLKIFPNPGNGLIFMEFLKSGDYQVSIFGADGRMIASSEFPAATGYRTMDISELNEGIYMIRIEGPDLSTTCKYVKR